MTNTGSQYERRQLAAAYVAGVQTLLAPAATRGVGVAERAAPAEDLLPASRALREAAAAGLTGGETALDRAAAEVQLLAGAALDLVVASHLAAGEAPATRGLAAAPADIAELQALIEAPEAYLVGAVAGRGVRAVGDARTAMTGAVRAALSGIRSDVLTTGGHVVQGLLLLDAALLKEALRVVGGDLAEKLGIDLAGISRHVINFVIAANDKILALLGIDALDQARAQLAAWLADLRAGTLFPDLVDRLYGTAAIESEVAGWIADYSAGEAALLVGRDEVDLLAGRFAAKGNVVDKIATGLALVKLTPPALTPAGRIAIAVVYLGLLAYLVGAGYDHVDSDRMKLLDWVEGVRGISQRLLVTPPA